MNRRDVLRGLELVVESGRRELTRDLNNLTPSDKKKGVAMMRLRIQAYVAMVISLLPALETFGAEREPKQLQTGTLGGVPNPDGAALRAMHEGSYILHARGGKLTNVPVEKVKLPGKLGEEGTPISMGPDGAVYVIRHTIMCKSTDGGRTWQSYKHAPELNGFFQILADGTLICVTQDLDVWGSKDEGRTCNKLADIKLPTEPFMRYVVFGLDLLPEGTLLWRVKLYGIESNGKDTLLLYRSTDNGQSWQGPDMLADWSSQGGMVVTPSGKLLATLRYQRKLLAGDGPDTDQRGFKHLFLADSPDKGLTWQNLRPLTTVYGQCYGCPAVQSDGTVVVIHDTRYGPGHRGSRAMVSYDEGQTWADEVYYLTYTEDRAEPSFSVVLEDDTILSIVGADSTWQGPIDLFAIRWKPEKEEK